MSFKTILTLALCLVTTTVSADSRPNLLANDDAQAMEKEILRLEEVGRQKVLKGDNDWDDLIADGAYMIAYDGSIIHYQKGLRLPSLVMKSFTMSEMIARVYGEVAVVTGLAEAESETAEKKPFSFKMRFLNVWKKSADGWKIVVSERTGVRPPPAKWGSSSRRRSQISGSASELWAPELCDSKVVRGEILSSSGGEILSSSASASPSDVRRWLRPAGKLHEPLGSAPGSGFAPGRDSLPNGE